MGQTRRTDDDKTVIRKNKRQLRDVVLMLDECLFVFVDPRGLVPDRGRGLDFVDRRK